MRGAVATFLSVRGVSGAHSATFTSAAQGAKPRQMLGGFGDDPRTMRARPGLDSITVRGGAAAVWLQAVKVALLP